MDKKLRQVTDSVHGTIYLSELESELISTPYFYRLHDIYQSSTVYMTFPSNRTKRYEHSLGTMSLASRILFSAVTNADGKTRELLFKRLKKYFRKITEKISKGNSCENIYFTQRKEKIERLFDSIGKNNKFDDFIGYINGTIKSGGFKDAALDHFQYYPSECIENSDEAEIENIFLYRCLMQAVRIVALFHDVGHPPYSHIIECVLKDLYKAIETDKETVWDSEKVDLFKNCLCPFLTKEPKKAFNCKRLISQSSLIDAQPHERIGLGFLSYAIDDVVPLKISDVIDSSFEQSQKIAHLIYYITVVEFVFAILTEKDMFFKSFHKIVDGPLDSDRLDYIVRDSQNSGVDWGKIPYERVINSAKLFYLTKDNNGNELKNDNVPFVVAYPQKISDDIEDLILVRYKIFARINFHHRCIRTTVALQESVRELATDYLTNKDNECINPDIHVLWTSLERKIGNKKIRAIQWNDSWLISVLHKALVNLHVSPELETKHSILKENLEEILLNKKKYYSLMKRGTDNCNFAKLILQQAQIDENLINQIKDKEYKKYYSCKTEKQNEGILQDPKSEALDSVGRLSDIFNDYDLESLVKFIPLNNKELNEILEEALKKCENLTNFAVIINKDKGKNGLPKHEDVLDAIYLYKKDNCTLFNEKFSLDNQINSIAKHIPWLYIYFVPDIKKCTANEMTKHLDDVLSKSVGIELKKRFEELFHGKIQIE